MMRTAAVAFLLLSSCDSRTPDTGLAVKAGEQSAQIQELKERVDRLQDQLTSAQSLELADAANTRDALALFRKTFNDDVKVYNGRFESVRAIDRRLAKYDGQRSTDD